MADDEKKISGHRAHRTTLKLNQIDKKPIHCLLMLQHVYFAVDEWIDDKEACLHERNCLFVLNFVWLDVCFEKLNLISPFCTMV